MSEKPYLAGLTNGTRRCRGNIHQFRHMDSDISEGPASPLVCERRERGNCRGATTSILCPRTSCARSCCPMVRNQRRLLQIGVATDWPGSGDLELQVGGASGAKEVFRAGDICLTEDRTGDRHLNRIRGAMHVTNFVIETEDLWPYNLSGK